MEHIWRDITEHGLFSPAENTYRCERCGAITYSDDDGRWVSRDCKEQNKRRKLRRRKRERDLQRQRDAIRQYRRLAHARNWWKPPYIIGRDQSPF